ncbi:hypothetical protein CK203_056537 [Vitis vinifera]|uniref:Integrase catalytic domain-containing protein n=1 Tax=Vitis vinifera TaxID=29760 RepID=A0A438GEJ9_VITVI|nr:hypothetical protein CK203_056537 [Vitis vinifera]
MPPRSPKSLPSVGYSRKSYPEVTYQRLARGKLVHFHGWKSLALPSVGPAKTTEFCILALGTFPGNLSSKELEQASGGFRSHFAGEKWCLRNFVDTQEGCEIILNTKLSSWGCEVGFHLEVPSSLLAAWSCIVRRRSTLLYKMLRNHTQQKGDFATLWQKLPSARSDWLCNGCNFFVSTQNCTPFEVLDFDFLSFEMVYSIHHLDFRKCSKSAVTTVIRIGFMADSLCFFLAIRIHYWKMNSKLCPRFLIALLSLDLICISLGYQEIEALHDRKSIRGSIVADHLASLPTSKDRPVDNDFLDEEFVAMSNLLGWCMYFDCATNQSGYVIGVMLVSPQGDHIPRLRCLGLQSATLASSVDNPIDVVVRPFLIELRSAPTYCVLLEKQRSRIINFDQDSVDCMMREVHVGVCGPHMREHHVSPKISPKSSNGHEFILVAIDYFTKWVEAASYARLTSARDASLIKSHIIYRYKVPHELITDRRVHFRAEVDTLLHRYNIQHHRSSAYRPQTNGTIKAANKNIKRTLRKMVETS